MYRYKESHLKWLALAGGIAIGLAISPNKAVSNPNTFSMSALKQYVEAEKKLINDKIVAIKRDVNTLKRDVKKIEKKVK